jgi:hypothetical protein
LVLLHIAFLFTFPRHSLLANLGFCRISHFYLLSLGTGVWCTIRLRREVWSSPETEIEVEARIGTNLLINRAMLPHYECLTTELRKALSHSHYLARGYFLPSFEEFEARQYLKCPRKVLRPTSLHDKSLLSTLSSCNGRSCLDPALIPDEGAFPHKSRLPNSPRTCFPQGLSRTSTELRACPVEQHLPLQFQRARARFLARQPQYTVLPPFLFVALGYRWDKSCIFVRTGSHADQVTARKTGFAKVFLPLCEISSGRTCVFLCVYAWAVIRKTLCRCTNLTNLKGYFGYKNCCSGRKRQGITFVPKIEVSYHFQAFVNL